MRRLLAAVLAVAAVCGLSACGLGSGSPPASTQLTITRDFGTRQVAELTQPKVGGSDTVMRLLQRNASVRTRYGGGFVQSIDGIAGGTRHGRPVAWFFYVNGIESEKGAAAVKVHPGDRVWWDFHDWGAAQRIPAVVGSFPDPFAHGQGGKRYPVRLQCANSATKACDAASKSLADAGVTVSRAALSTSASEQTLRVLVGPWPAIRDDFAARQIESGPGASGVYGRMAPDGRSLAVLDPTGRTVRTLRAGTGLIAATRFRTELPTWVVTGTDAAGLLSAAQGLREDVLGNHFALAISNDVAVPLPQVPR
jgi:Domain of unknown function (DUF4430)